MKKLKIFAMALIASVLIIGGVKALTSEELATARAGSSEIQSYSGVNLNKKIPKEYNFVLYRPSSSTQGPVSGRVLTNNDKTLDAAISEWETRYNSLFTTEESREAWRREYSRAGSLVNNDIKGKYSVTYPAVGIYNNTVIDVKATLIDYEAQSISGVTPLILLTDTYIGNKCNGVTWIKVKYEFFKTGTSTRVSVKGNTSYYEVDGNQALVLDGTNKGIYATNDSILKINKINNDYYVGAFNGGNGEKKDPKYAFSEIFEGNTIIRTFSYKEYPESANPNNIDNGGMFHSAEPVSAAELPKPLKTVNKNKVDLDEEFTYTITQKIPAQLPQHYYKSYRIEDILESPLEVKQSNISIKNGNTDVTNNFTITVDGQKINIVANNVSDDNFYGKTYTITIKTKIKSEADLTNYKSKEGYTIPNHATAYYKDHTDPADETPVQTEIVNVIYGKYKLIVHHYLEGTTTELAPDELYDKEYNEPYQTNRASSISNEYELVATPDNANGTIKGDTEVTYYYKKKTGLIVNVPKTAAAISAFALVFSIIAIAGSCIVLYLLVHKNKSKK